MLGRSSSATVRYPAAYMQANRAALGDVAQSMVIQSDRAYVVVNNSNKVEVVSLPHFKSVASIGGLKLPRYFVAASSIRAT